MSIYKSSTRYLRNCKLKTLKEYTADCMRHYVELDDSIETIKSSDLIKMLQDLQEKYNTTDLVVRTVVTDGYYETANLLIERLETDEEFNERVERMYEREKAQHERAVASQEKEEELEKLIQQQAEIQEKINSLK